MLNPTNSMNQTSCVPMCEAVSKQLRLSERADELDSCIGDSLGVAVSIQSGLMGSQPCEEKNIKCYGESLEGFLISANDRMRELRKVLSEIRDRI